MLWQITEFTVCLYRWESGPDFPFVLLSTRPLCLCFMYAWKRSLEYLLLNQSRFTCLHDQTCTYSLYIHFHLSLNILKRSVPPQPTTFHCPNKPTENHRFLSLFFPLLVLVSIQTSFLFISHNSCRPRLPSESVLNICRQAVVEVYILCGCLHGPHYAVSCINSQLLLSHLPIYAHTLLLLRKLLSL